MVTFTCMQCSESLRKPAVAKHIRRCRGGLLSCIDCGQDFDEESYKAHTSCISEAERYQGALFKAKAKKIKVSPQEKWSAAIAFVAQNCSGESEQVQEALQKLAEADNCPRKKAKFTNYLRNTCRAVRAGDIPHIFELVEKRRVAAQEEEQAAKKSGEEAEYRASKRKPNDGKFRTKSENKSLKGIARNRLVKVLKLTNFSNNEGPGLQREKKRIRWRKTCRDVIAEAGGAPMSLSALQAGVVTAARNVYGTSGALTGFTDTMINHIVSKKAANSRHLVVGESGLVRVKGSTVKI